MKVKIHNKPARVYTHEGNSYIEAREGTEYSIQLHNTKNYRHLFVVSVDGINVISGKPAKDDDSAGYVLKAYETFDLKGFRINDNDVATFKFGKAEDSYAAEMTGSTANTGVIGVKVYEEKIRFTTYNTTTPIPANWWHAPEQQFPSYPSVVCDSSKAGFCGSSLSHVRSGASFDLGTAWGAQTSQPVTSVDFEKGYLAYTQLYYYASREQLEKLGIKFEPEKIAVSLPSAFGETKNTYCPVPKNWKG